MSTKLFFRLALTTSPYQYSSGTNSAKLDTTTAAWQVMSLATTAGAAQTNSSQSTVAGPTNGIEMTKLSTSIPIHWVSAPLDQDVTISGTITLNLWAFETTMSDNAAINAIVERIDSTGAIGATVAQTARVTEVAVTTSAVNNFTVTPTSTAFNKGDRIRVRVYADDAGTMAATGSCEFDFDGPTGGSNGDSFITFTETFGFLTTDPTTTTVYPANVTPSPSIDPDSGSPLSRDMWTSRGSGSQFITAVTANGWTAPLVLSREGFTRQLTAFTLSAPVLVNVRALMFSATKHAAIRAELAVTASDGTGATVWAATSHPTQLTTTDTAYVFYLAGDDLAITDGQRLRLRFYGDDESTTAMVSGDTIDVTFSGTSGGAAGDTFLTFGQTLTEFVASGGIVVNHLPFIPQGRSM